jgi:hypothetical protein
MKKPEKKSISTPPKTFSKPKETVNAAPLFSLKNVIIIAVALLSYAAAVFNDYALDDFIVLVKNRFVQNGFAGIGGILGNDTFAGMTESNLMVLSGGRYRPLSLVTFAMEHQLWGNSPFLSHLINVLLYAFTGVVLYRFLNRVFHKQEPFAFFTTLLFIALPVHSEAVINIKGRDDILCFLFFLLTMQYLFKQLQTQKISDALLAYGFFFLSLLSKETAVTFIAIVPLTLYFFTAMSIKDMVKKSVLFVALTGLFLLMRYFATMHNNGTISEDLFNNPFVNMSFEQHYGTVFLSWLIYLKLLFYPLQLSYDYNFNQISATGFTDVAVLISLLVHVSLISIALLFFNRKSVYAYGILFYLITFSIVSNLFFNIGAPLAERFMYIPSLGICLVVIQFCFDGYNYLADKMETAVLKKSCYAVAGIVVLLSCYRNVLRCMDWKNNNTLFIADVKSVPNNAKAHLNAGIAYIDIAGKLEMPRKQIPLDSAKIHLIKGIAIYPQFVDGYLNMGVIYNWENNFDSAEVWWNRARKIKPDNSSLAQYDKVLATHFYQIGLKNATDKKYEACIADFLKAYLYDSLNADICYNMGGVYFTVNDFANAKRYWEKTLQLNPNNQQAAGGLQAANQKLAGF